MWHHDCQTASICIKAPPLTPHPMHVIESVIASRCFRLICPPVLWLFSSLFFLFPTVTKYESVFSCFFFSFLCRIINYKFVVCDPLVLLNTKCDPPFPLLSQTLCLPMKRQHNPVVGKPAHILGTKPQ